MTNVNEYRCERCVAANTCIVCIADGGGFDDIWVPPSQVVKALSTFGVPRLSFAQPCCDTVITLWPPELARWISKTRLIKARPWHPIAYGVMHLDRDTRSRKTWRHHWSNLCASKPPRNTTITPPAFHIGTPDAQ